MFCTLSPVEMKYIDSFSWDFWTLLPKPESAYLTRHQTHLCMAACQLLSLVTIATGAYIKLPFLLFGLICPRERLHLSFFEKVLWMPLAAHFLWPDSPGIVQCKALNPGSLLLLLFPQPHSCDWAEWPPTFCYLLLQFNLTCFLIGQLPSLRQCWF